MLYSEHQHNYFEGVSRLSFRKSGHTPQIGEVYMMKFTGSGNEQSGWRPGLVFQNNVGNSYSPNIIAIPLTTSIKKANQPTHIVVYANDSGLLKDSMVLCENPERMSKANIGKYITTLSDKYMKQIAEANILASSAIAYLDMSALQVIWEKAIALNAVVPA